MFFIYIYRYNKKNKNIILVFVVVVSQSFKIVVRKNFNLNWVGNTYILKRINLKYVKEKNQKL